MNFLGSRLINAFGERRPNATDRGSTTNGRYRKRFEYPSGKLEFELRLDPSRPKPSGHACVALVSADGTR
jgi:hypothetical protein